MALAGPTRPKKIKNCHPERSATVREPAAAGEREKERAVEGPRVSFPAHVADSIFTMTAVEKPQRLIFSVGSVSLW